MSKGIKRCNPTRIVDIKEEFSSTLTIPAFTDGAGVVHAARDVTFYRVVALKDMYRTIDGKRYLIAKAGDLGGWVETIDILFDNAWIGDEAMATYNTMLRGDAYVYGNAKILDYARVSNTARIYEDAILCEGAVASEQSAVAGSAIASGNTRICGNSVVRENALVFGDSTVAKNSIVEGKSRVYDAALVSGDSTVGGNARIYDNAEISGSARIGDNAQVYENATVSGINAGVSDNAQVFGNAYIRSKVSGNAWVVQGTHGAKISGNYVTKMVRPLSNSRRSRSRSPRNTTNPRPNRDIDYSLLS